MKLDIEKHQFVLAKEELPCCVPICTEFGADVTGVTGTEQRVFGAGKMGSSYNDIHIH